MLATRNLPVFVACTSVLYVKFLVVAVVQSAKSLGAGERPPEDNQLPSATSFPTQNFGLIEATKNEGKSLEPTVQAQARSVAIRWRRMVANDLECIPLSLFVFAGGVLANANETVFVYSMVVYTAARCTFSVAFAKKLQPQRSIVWVIAKASVFVAMGNTVCALVALARD